MFKAQIRPITDAGQVVTLVMQMLRKQKLPRALSQARRLPVREFSDKILVGKAEARVGLLKAGKFRERGWPVLEVLREKGSDARIEPSELCWRDHHAAFSGLALARNSCESTCCAGVPCDGKKIAPSIRRVPAIKQLPKNRIGVVRALVGAQRRVIVDPGEHDYFGVSRLLVAKEQPELLQEFRAKPVLVVITKRASLPVDVASRVTGDILKRHLQHSREELCGALLPVSLRIFFARLLDRRDYSLELV